MDVVAGLAVDYRDAIAELHPMNGDYLRLAGRPEVQEYLNSEQRIQLAETPVERVVFADAVHKSDHAGVFDERHLLVTNLSLIYYSPHVYKKPRRDIDLRRLYGVICSSSSHEIVFKVAKERDVRMRFTRRSECLKAISSAYLALSRSALPVAWTDQPLLASVTKLRRHLSQRNSTCAALPGDQLLGLGAAQTATSSAVRPSWDLSVTMSASSQVASVDGADDSVSKNLSAFQALRLDPNRDEVVPRASVAHDESPVAHHAAALYEGWLAKKSSSHRYWRPRYYRLVAPNLQCFKGRLEGITQIEDGVVKLFPRSKLNEDCALEKFLLDPAKVSELKAFARSLGQEATIDFYLDVKAFQEMPRESTQQFNAGQRIFEKYIRPGAPHEVFLWDEMREDLLDSVVLAHDRKLLPPTIFDDALRQILSQLRSDTFPRFVAQRRKRSSQDVVTRIQQDECPNCLTTYTLTNRRAMCDYCNNQFCHGCTGQVLSFTEPSTGTLMTGKVCDMCDFALSGTSKSNYAFSYVSKSRGRPLYMASSSHEEMMRWIKAIGESIEASKCPHGSQAVHRLEGWLKKRCHKGTWRSLYFILEGCTMRYFSMKYTGSILITRGVGAHASSQTGSTAKPGEPSGVRSRSDFAYRFILSNSDRVYNLAADTEEEMYRWIDVLKNMAKGPPDEYGAEDASAVGQGSVDYSAELSMPSIVHNSFFQEAPTGEVTFVFTDIQSSTVLWERCSDMMDLALKHHDKIVRDHLRQFKGYEVKTEGDAFMVSFASAELALSWCIAVQNALLYCSWPEDLVNCHESARRVIDDNGRIVFCGLRVRMGVNVGYPNCRRNPVTSRMDYFGSVVNRASRIADSAHGGQIVCDRAVYEAVRDTFPGVFTDLGTHAYKGISEAVHVFQVSSPDLVTRTFPPLRTAAAESNGVRHWQLTQAYGIVKNREWLVECKIHVFYT
ncbi:unnamed protein product (mitochondrion) [Plasmodiophora brassicae]|uniref:Adenylate cyclase n=1 Tax=Plasmodiophora brassicae TaxID=37360 RepID=A0A3P3YK01_PLABS|nr:unnamed protein product [Plasmodiophora brassicae]